MILLTWIRIDQILWIRIRLQSIRIHITAFSVLIQKPRTPDHSFGDNDKKGCVFACCANAAIFFALLQVKA